MQGTRAVAVGFILWKRAKGQERIERSRNSGGGGEPRKTSEPGREDKGKEGGAKPSNAYSATLQIL